MYWMFSWWVGCGPPSYSEQLEAFRTAMAPAVEQYRGLSTASLPAGAQSLVAGRKVLVLEDGAPRYVSDYVDGRDQPPPGFAVTADEVGVVVLAKRTRNPEPLYTYTDGTHGFSARYELVAVAVPENVVVARWTGAATPPLQKLDLGGPRRDEESYYTDYDDDVARLLAGTDPGRSTYQDEDDAFRAGVAAVVDRVGALDVSALPDGSVADAAGRAALVVEGKSARDPKYGERGNPAFATDAAGTGLVVWLRRTPDTTPSTVYDDGVPGYGSTYEIVALLWPEERVVARLTRRVEPPPSVMATRRERVDGLLGRSDLSALVATLREGRLP